MQADWSPTALQAMLSGLQLLIDGDPMPGKLLTYSGTKPAIPGDTPAGNLQAAVVLAKPCASIVGTALQIIAPVEGQRIGAETIAWARLINGSGLWVGDFDAGLPGSGSAIELSALDGFPGAFVRLTSASIAF